MFGTANANPQARDRGTLYRLERQTYISGALDFVSQIGRHHELKVGGDVRRYTARRFEIEPWVMRLTEDGTPTDPKSIDAVTFATQGEYTGYGFDLYGNEIDDDGFSQGAVGNRVPVDGPKNPVFTAVYVQDKIEYSDLIINAGLRLDIFDTDDVRLKDPGNPEVNDVTGLISEDAFEEVDPFKQVSPRLGISFPVTERTKFYAQYGKFIQMPELRNIYHGNFGLSDQITSGGNFFVNTIGFGLDPIKTTSYELGFSQQVGKVAALDVTGFYRNDKGQITVVREESTGPNVATYARLANADFTTTKGVELRLRLRRINRLQAQINYTLTQAEGSGSGELSFRGAIDQATPTPTLINPLDFSQTHKGSVILDYRFGKNDGGPVLQQLGTNVIFSFNSGHPYTKIALNQLGQSEAYDAGVDYMLDSRTREAAEPINSSTTPWNFNVDLRLDKSFNVTGDISATIYSRVTNLFNTRNVLNVYQLTGDDDNDGVITDPQFGEELRNTNGGEDYAELYNAINIQNGQSYFSQLTNTAFTNTVQRRADLWGHPRQIWLGLEISY
ncbi:MAG: TonB-dependent receptor [Aliifodinibius sp.]|nr:TonB-dependent receptor [candidate division Zixibacteria bacterium]NIT61811.1 TonB-dependent receptor [Fodinibius sp.]NIW50257.1 TonB-dependent receptor [Gammaproteobacteria bacterium]NIS47573.1 TonB-dependent receptor [candidate division Zixibacteria bacterium]NIU17255.1 TonB-dependent receptor [candidate division Zixibacteria bacterium]